MYTVLNTIQFFAPICINLGVLQYFKPIMAYIIYNNYFHSFAIFFSTTCVAFFPRAIPEVMVLGVPEGAVIIFMWLMGETKVATYISHNSGILIDYI